MPNIILLGKSGVGKSTLINAIIGDTVADENVGSPVTSEITPYPTEIQGTQWKFFDTVGISNENCELFYNVIIDRYIKKKNPELTCDMAWVCISEGSSRIEDVEIDLINKIVCYIPVIVVLTKAYFKSGLETEIRNQFPEVQNVIRVNSEVHNINGIIIEKSNIKNLVKITDSIINNNKMGNINVASIEKLTSNDLMKIIEENTISVAHLVMPTKKHYKEILDKMVIGTCTYITNELNLNKQFHEIEDNITHLKNEYLKNEKKYYDNVKKLIPFCSSEINIEYATYFYSIGKMYLNSFKSKHENNTLNDDRLFSSMNNTPSLMNTTNNNNNKNNNSSMKYQNSNQSINNNRCPIPINKNEYSNQSINIDPFPTIIDKYLNLTSYRNNNISSKTLYNFRNTSSPSLINTNSNNNKNNENNGSNKNKNISSNIQVCQSQKTYNNMQWYQKNDNGNSKYNCTDYDNKNLKKRSEESNSNGTTVKSKIKKKLRKVLGNNANYCKTGDYD